MSTVHSLWILSAAKVLGRIVQTVLRSLKPVLKSPHQSPYIIVTHPVTVVSPPTQMDIAMGVEKYSLEVVIGEFSVLPQAASCVVF